MRTMTWWLCVMVMVLAGCATDGPGDMTGDREDPNACSNPCEAGETRCAGTVVEACAADARGCFNWSSGLDCAADGLQCDDSAEPAICLDEPGTCQDNAVNQDESDVDCGGLRCVACDIGDTCNGAEDCESNNCDLGVTDACVPEDQPTCTDGELNGAETDVDCGGGVCQACEEGAECTMDADCESGTCDADGTCAPGGGPCNNGDVQCVGNTVQTCEARNWVETQICAQGCDMGACADEVQCTPMENRCFKNSVQVCNAQGTAWGHLDICEEDCDRGLCVGACEPNALRCNGDTQEICGIDGATWASQEDCTLGCSRSVCIEQNLQNMGVPMTMSGTHVYQDCVSIELGGSIEVPADETLEIWAKCLEVTSSSFITLNSGAQFIFHATETIDNQGSISGGDLVRLDAYQSLTNAGDVSSGRVELRGDVLTNAATGTIGGDAYALYGSEWNNDGTHEGAESVMPPVTLSSPTHPEGFQWNMVDDDVSIAWDKPFASVRGYYINVNTTTIPSPSSGEFTTVENVTLPLRLFRPGSNTVQVVSVNADSTVGTEPTRFTIDFNVSSPNVSSSSHPDSFDWSSSDDIFIEWTESPNIDPNSYVGYWYAWDHRGDTRPDENVGIFRNDDKILFDNQAPGVWMFHLVSIDRLGRTSPVPARYEVRVGPEPEFGNIAGNIKDDNGDPLRGATVLLNGGIYRATTVASGDYTFRGEVPAVAFDWEVEVKAPGFVGQSQTVRMAGNDVEIMDFSLARDTTPAAYELGFPVLLDSGYSFASNSQLDIAMGRPGEVIWSTPDMARISSTTGTNLRSMSASSSYSHVDVGYDGNHYFSAYTVYSSSYYRPQIQLVDSSHAQILNRTIQSWATMYHPSVVWDGTRFVVTGSYYSLNFGSIDPNDPDTDGEVMESNQSTTTSSSRTKAVYDGAAIAVAVMGYDSNASAYFIYLGRYSRDGAEVLAPVKLPTEVRGSQPFGLAFDGSNYHVTFKAATATASGKYPIYVQSVSQAGVVGTLTELDQDTDAYSAPQIAFDGRNLLVVYEVENEGVLEVRDPDDHNVVDTFDLGRVRYPSVDFGFHAGSGAIIYAEQDAPRGTYMRQIIIR